MAMEIKELIKALRCASVPHSGERPDCMNCRFCSMEEVKEDIPIHADVEIDGVKLWLSCDVDMIMQCAAEMLEVFAKRDRRKKPDRQQDGLEVLNLTTRCYNALRRNGVHTVDALTGKSYEELAQLPEVGKKLLEELVTKLREHGIEIEEQKEGGEDACE